MFLRFILIACSYSLPYPLVVSNYDFSLPVVIGVTRNVYVVLIVVIVVTYNIEMP